MSIQSPEKKQARQLIIDAVGNRRGAALILSGKEGAEACALYDLGFRDIIAVERDPGALRIVRKLIEQGYVPEHKIICDDILNVVLHLRNKQFVYIHLDYYGPWIPAHKTTLKFIAEKQLLHPQGVIATTFMRARERGIIKAEIDHMMDATFIPTKDDVWINLVSNDFEEYLGIRPQKHFLYQSTTPMCTLVLSLGT